MKAKAIPPILMLSAGAICTIVMYMKHYELKNLLSVLLAVLVVFYIAGLCIKKMLESFTLANEARVKEEGEVIEKEAEDTEDTENVAEEGESAQTEE